MDVFKAVLHHAMSFRKLNLFFELVVTVSGPNLDQKKAKVYTSPKLTKRGQTDNTLHHKILSLHE